MAKENLNCKNQKSTSQEFRDNFDRIFGHTYERFISESLVELKAIFKEHGRDISELWDALEDEDGEDEDGKEA